MSDTVPNAMLNTKIIAILLVKNEDRFIGQVIANILDFCDEIIITDNESTDSTWKIITNLAEANPKLKAIRIAHPRQSHEAIEQYAGTNTWIFGVDGDEIYDPEGLAKMRELLLSGAFSCDWAIFGNVLNCTAVDLGQKTARGHLAPPCRSMTKLYNFSLLESWTGCPERLHSGNKIFKAGTTAPKRRKLFNELDWDSSYFRCLHMAFLPRSSQSGGRQGSTKLNPAEIEAINSAFSRKAYLKGIFRHIKYHFGPDWKNRKYKKGPQVEKEITAFV